MARPSIPASAWRRVAIVAAAVLASIGAGCTGGGEAATTSEPSAETTAPIADTGATDGTDAAAEHGEGLRRDDHGDWLTVEPAAAGFDPERLGELAAVAQDANSNCWLVVRDGAIVAEEYWNGTGPTSAQEVFSASKSVTSTLVGIASGDGALSVTDPASRWITEWQGTPSETVTVEDLLSNVSGRHYDPRTDYVEMAIRGTDKNAIAIGLGQDAPPGEVWAYNNSAIQTLSAVLQGATGTDQADLAEQRLFGPLGMDDTSISRDAAGTPLAFMGVRSTCRDMARFGQLALDRGVWDGEQVVPEGWFDSATGRSSQELNASYGWLWWLNRRGPTMGEDLATVGAGGEPAPVEEGQLVPGAPDDMFFALGLGGQVVAVDPGSRTVVVRLGPFPPGDVPSYGSDEAAAVVTEALIDPEGAPGDG